MNLADLYLELGRHARAADAVREDAIALWLFEAAALVARARELYELEWTEAFAYDPRLDDRARP